LTTLDRALSLPAGSKPITWADPFTLGALLVMQVLEPAAPLSIGTLYILDDGSDVAIVRLQGESPDLWIVDRFSGDGGCRRCALARRRWHPRAAITIQ
jgi:hypothetical protein